MSQWRVAFRRIGGPDAVTWPAFWATFASNLFGHFTALEVLPLPLWVRLLAVTAGQLAMFVPLVILRFTLLRDPARPHPWVALAGFAIAPLFRTTALVWVLATIGGVENPQWAQRALASFANLFVVLLISALVVSAWRAHARTLHQLLAVQRDLELTRAQVQGQVDLRNEEALARVKATLEREIAGLESGSDAVGSLQRLATDVVRPMSHELAQSMPAWAPEPKPQSVRVARAEIVRDLGMRGPFLPLVSAAIMTLLALATTQTYLASVRIVVLACCSVGVATTLWIANRILDRVLPLRTPARSLALVLAASIVAGFIPGAIAGIAFGGGRGVVLALSGTAFSAGIALMAATIRAVLAQQQRSEAELLESTEQLRANLVRLHQIEWFQRKALSRALHGPVQSAATAAALRLDAAVRSGNASPQLVDEVREALLREVDVLDGAAQPPLPIDQLAERLAGTWAGVCAVQLEFDEAGFQALCDDAVLRSTAHEIMTEAVSNAVRHGRAQEVGITVSMAPDAPEILSVVVDDDGRGELGASSGLGTQILDQCALRWSLEATPDGRRLRAWLPVPQAV